MQMKYPNEELLLWVESRIKAEPGIWTARLCRLLNGCELDTEAAIIHCGYCQDYANPRKRNRAEVHNYPTLPGLEPPHQLHPPCRSMPLRKLRYLLDVLENTADLVYSVPGSEIPDIRQPRGWDYGTRFYPAE